MKALGDVMEGSLKFYLSALFRKHSQEKGVCEAYKAKGESQIVSSRD